MMGLQFVGNKRPAAPRGVKLQPLARSIKLHINKNEKPISIEKKYKASKSSTNVNGLVM